MIFQMLLTFTKMRETDSLGQPYISKRVFKGGSVRQK